jgi:transmembrane sensor
MKKENTYQSINQRINQSVRHYRVPYRIEKDAALNSLMNRIGNEERSPEKTMVMPHWMRTVAAVAAVLLLVFISGHLLFTQKISNTGKEVVTLRLPDHSRVVLAAQSQVKYNKLTWNRKVKLNGKAYFEVKKGSTFQVNTPGGNVQVLGTRFLVEGKDDQMEVICFEGRVKAANRQDEVLLAAGSGVRLSPNEKQLTTAGRDAYPGIAKYTAVYTNAELDKVLKDMSAFFGVRVSNQVKQNRYFTGSLNTGNMETALTIVTSSLKLDYKIGQDNTVVIY